MRHVRIADPTGPTRWLTVPDQADLDTAYAAGVRDGARARHLDTAQVRADATSLAATLPRDPDPDVAARRKELATW